MVTRAACPVCQEAGANAIPESANYDVCSACGVVYRKTFDPLRPEDGEDQAYYSNDPVVEYYLKRRSGFRKMVQIVNRLFARRGKWLDLGCGIGVLLQVAHDSGWDVYGVDRSRVCVAAASERMQYAGLVHGPIDERLAEFSGLSVVSAHDMLRYVENPGRILAGAYDTLSDGGWVVIREVKSEVGRETRSREAAATKLSFDVPLQLWNPRSLENGLRRVGFRSVRSIPAPAFTETGRYVRDGRRWLSGQVERIAKRGFWPVARMVHGLSGGRLHIGPNFITLGQK